MKRTVEKDKLILEEPSQFGTVPRQLTMQSHIENGTATVTLRGAVSSEQKDDFMDELLALLSAGNSICLDMAGVTYIAPEVIDRMINAQIDYFEPTSRALVLRAMPKPLLDMFRAYNYAQQFTIEGSEKR